MRSLLLAEYDGVAPSNGSRDERIGTQGQAPTGGRPVQTSGEVAERLKAHDSKSCEGLYPSEGSNPSLSAKYAIKT